MANRNLNSSNIMQELQKIENWGYTHKKQYSVYMCKPPIGTKVYNFLEGSHYETSCKKPYVLSGTVGEQWIIDEEKLCKTYMFKSSKNPLTPESLKGLEKNTVIDWVELQVTQEYNEKADAASREKHTTYPLRNWAIFLPINSDLQSFPVKTAWGETLLANRPEVKHFKGDYIVASDLNGQPNLNDVWVVNGEIFPTTYDMTMFKGLGGEKLKAETVKPTTKVPIPDFVQAWQDNSKTMNSVSKALNDAKISNSIHHDSKNNYGVHGKETYGALADTNHDVWTIELHSKVPVEQSVIVDFAPNNEVYMSLSENSVYLLDNIKLKSAQEIVLNIRDYIDDVNDMYTLSVGNVLNRLQNHMLRNKIKFEKVVHNESSEKYTESWSVLHDTYNGYIGTTLRFKSIPGDAEVELVIDNNSDLTYYGRVYSVQRVIKYMQKKLGNTPVFQDNTANTESPEKVIKPVTSKPKVNSTAGLVKGWFNRK